MKVSVQYKIEWNAYAVYCYHEIEGRQRDFQQPDGTFITVRPGERLDIAPTFLLDWDTVPKLLEALQQAGVRPVELSKVEGKLEAQSAHLADLQKILRKQKVME